METYFCEGDCGTCRNSQEEKSICMQARVISDLCQSEGVSLEEGIRRYAAAFRDLWESGIQDRYELTEALREVNRRIYRIVPPVNETPLYATLFPIHLFKQA